MSFDIILNLKFINLFYLLYFMEIASILISFITIFIIMDPFASLPSFLALTQGHNKEQLAKTANKAVLIAGILALIFVFSGTAILNVLSITLSDFRIAGGIVLGLLGLENVLGFSFSNHNGKKIRFFGFCSCINCYSTINRPWLNLKHCCFGARTQCLYCPNIAYRSIIPFMGYFKKCDSGKNLLGDKIILIFSKVMGLLLIAMGIAYIKVGILG